MERLTKRLSNGEVMHNCGKCPKVNEKDFCSEKNCASVILNRLAELEDKLENGEFIELSALTIYQVSVGCAGTSLENYFIDEIMPSLIKLDGRWALEYKNRLCAEPERGIGGRALIGYFTDKARAEACVKRMQHGKD